MTTRVEGRVPCIPEPSGSLPDTLSEAMRVLRGPGHLALIVAAALGCGSQSSEETTPDANAGSGGSRGTAGGSAEAGVAGKDTGAAGGSAGEGGTGSGSASSTDGGSPDANTVSNG